MPKVGTYRSKRGSTRVHSLAVTHSPAQTGTPFSLAGPRAGRHKDGGISGSGAESEFRLAMDQGRRRLQARGSESVRSIARWGPEGGGVRGSPSMPVKPSRRQGAVSRARRSVQERLSGAPAQVDPCIPGLCCKGADATGLQGEMSASFQGEIQ